MFPGELRRGFTVLHEGAQCHPQPIVLAQLLNHSLNDQPVKGSRAVGKGIRLHTHLLLDCHKYV